MATSSSNDADNPLEERVSPEFRYENVPKAKKKQEDKKSEKRKTSARKDVSDADEKGYPEATSGGPSDTRVEIRKDPGKGAGYTEFHIEKTPGAKVEVSREGEGYPEATSGGGGIGITYSVTTTPPEHARKTKDVSRAKRATMETPMERSTKILKESFSPELRDIVLEPERTTQVSMSPREAYETGIISETAMRKGEERGLIYYVSSETVAAAEKAKRELGGALRSAVSKEFRDVVVTPLDKIPPTHSPLSMYQRKKRREYYDWLEKEEWYEEAAESPLTKTVFAVYHDWVGAGTLTDFGAAYMTGKGYEGFYAQKKQEIKSFTREAEASVKGQQTAVFGLKYGSRVGATVAMASAGGGGLGSVAQKATRWIYRGIIGVSTYEYVKEPTAEKAARLFLIATPEAVSVTARGIGKIPWVKSKIEMRRLTKGMGPKEKAFFEKQFKMSKELGKVRPQIKEIELPSRIPKKAGGITKRYLRESGDIVGGSVAQRTQVYGRQRLPHDIDIFSGKPSKSAATLFKRMKTGGVKDITLKISKKGTMMESGKIFVKGRKAIEFHTTEWMKAFPFTQKTVKTPGGTKVLSIGEQLTRKVYGGAAGRTKDISDFFRASKSLVKTRKLYPQRRPFPVLARGMKGQAGIKLSDVTSIKAAAPKTTPGKLYSPYPKPKTGPGIPLYPSYSPYRPGAKPPPIVLYGPGRSGRYGRYEASPSRPTRPYAPYKEEKYKRPSLTEITQKYGSYPSGTKPPIPYAPYTKPPKPTEPRYEPYDFIGGPKPPRPRKKISILGEVIRTRKRRKKSIFGKPPKKTYTPSYAGLLSGKTITKKPGGIRTGLGIRKPVKGKKKKEVSLI